LNCVREKRLPSLRHRGSAPAPNHAIARGRAGAGLLAHILVSTYGDHRPLCRQAESFAREGVGPERIERQQVGVARDEQIGVYALD
jgi:transposase